MIKVEKGPLGLGTVVLMGGIFAKSGSRGPASKDGARHSVEWWEGRGEPKESKSGNWVDPKWDEEADDVGAIGKQIEKGGSIGTEFSSEETLGLWPTYVVCVLLVVGAVCTAVRQNSAVA